MLSIWKFEEALQSHYTESCYRDHSMCSIILFLLWNILFKVLLKSNFLSSILLRNISLRNILLRNILLRNILLRNILLRNILLRYAYQDFSILEEDFQLLEIMLSFFVMAIPKVVKYIPNTGSSLPRSPCFHTKTGSSFRLLGTGSQTLESMLALLLSTYILRL